MQRRCSKNFSITDKELYVPVLALPTGENTKLLQHLKSGVKRIINRNKYQSKLSTQVQNIYFDYLIDPIFQEVNRIFVLSFKNEQIKGNAQDIIFQK